MARGNDQQTKVYYKGKQDNFVIFADNSEVVRNWKKDSSIPLAQVVSGWKVFTTHNQGNQGILDGASNGQLDSEFGTHNQEDVMKIILEKGTVQESENRERQGDTNMTRGPIVAH